MTANDFVTLFLKTPLHVFLGNTMLITVTGCKTGRTYSTPVGFYRDGDCLWILTSRDRTWWRNVRQGAHVELLLRGKTVGAFAQAEMDEDAVQAHLLGYLRHTPMAAKAMGVRMEQKSPDLEDVKRAAKSRLFVKVLPRR